MSLLTLGIESSCDETSAAVVADGRVVLSDVIASSLEFHKQYGGVVPEIASRKHAEVIDSVVAKALDDAGVTPADISNIGVTRGPGLIGALLVGVSAAKALAYVWDKPLVPVHHLEGHISANFLQSPELEPPFTCLVVSGGHSHIVRVSDYGKFTILGRTRDDAAGEAFDKIARALGLGYPGGPVIDREAKGGDPHAIRFPETRFPDSLDFSFSGLKTAVLNYMNNTRARGGEINISDVCASFQYAVVDVLSDNLIAAAEMTGDIKIALAGGVAANSALKEAVNRKAFAAGLEVFCPKPVLCTDNAAMIASAAHYAALNGRFAGSDMNAVANWSLEDL
ncbi:MAG: tRNA (adenosine(37)-N6)-threonylcarbamoyltransferase complex transferase subunit TsaD [Clostridia bacterium]|nr:tRNA (adenosine(37)-N6)-threonylcarbamoyltransferase complex transferase subunit TsaD [Clostridia bacterium]